MTFLKNANLWLPGYIRNRATNAMARRPAKRLWVTLADHFEPLGGNVPLSAARDRVALWLRRWPLIAETAPRDSAGRPPCFTFFYPQEEYNREILDSLAELSRSGTTDVEVHLHHHHDTGDNFRQNILTFCAQLHNDHGLLHHHNGRLVFGFIHGNWALDNANPADCGVMGELLLLRDLGCYADFTMPSVPSPTQSRILNQIYWAAGDPAKPRGYDSGVQATLGGGRRGDLLMIPGPLGLRFRDRLIPRVETGELAVYDPPTPYRIKRWLDLAPRIGDDIFLKLFGHSARDDNAAALLGVDAQPGTLASAFRWIHEAAQEHNLELHWSSAFQMFCAADALIQPTTGEDVLSR